VSFADAILSCLLVVAASNGAVLAVAVILDQLLHHATDNAELETEQDHHGSQYRRQPEHETHRHLPLVQVVATGQAKDLEQVSEHGLAVDHGFGQLAVIGVRGFMGKATQAELLDVTPGVAGQDNCAIEFFRQCEKQ